MAQDGCLREVVIAGGGTAGWMTAAALVYYFGDTLTITLVESEEIGTIGVGEATIPQIQLFNASLGIDENTFLRATGGTIKLGIEFVGWGDPAARYIHGFGQVGSAIGMLPFYQYWLRYHAEGGPLPLDAFSANVLAAQAGRVGRARGMAHAYHVDAGLYAAHLRVYAEKRGVRRVEGMIAGVRQDGASGHIRSLYLKGGGEVAGELFVDCTGLRSLLLGQTMEVGFDDWSHWLPCNRAWAVPTARTAAPEPLTRSTAREAGWQWHIPLQHRSGNGLVFAEEHLGEEAARDLLLRHLPGAPIAEPRLLRFATGKRRQLFKGNCVALGLAGGFLEPLESTSIHMIQSGISRLVAMFPQRGFDPAAVAEYNAQSDFEYASVRDFLILHYHLNAREGAFWRHCREITLPGSLAQKLALFAESGRIVRFNTELFDVPSWLQVMWGQGLRPRSHHPMVDAVSASDLANYIARTAREVAEAVAELEPHGAFIAANCAMTPAEQQAAAGVS